MPARPSSRARCSPPTASAAARRTPPKPGIGGLTLTVGQKRAAGVKLGAQRGEVTAAATGLARDLANTPPADLTARMMAERAVEVGRCRRPRGRGVQPRPAPGDGLRRNGRGQRRQRRAAAHGPPDVHAGQAVGPPRARRQGRDVRLRRDQPEAVRRHARDDEDGHERRRRGAGDDERADRARLPGAGHRLPDVHRQPAVRQCDEARRRPHVPQRQDRRDPQHRRGGPARARRRTVAGGRGQARCDRRHRHAHRRVRRRARPEDGRRVHQRRRLRRQGQGRRRCRRRADLAAAAGEGLPQR